MIGRRGLLTGGLAALAIPHALAQGTAVPDGASLTDGAGRTVPIPAMVQRVFAAGPPAAILLYTLAPDLLIGWPRALSSEERDLLLLEIGARPETGRITGRGNTANLEVVLALKPDLILDSGSTRGTFASLADRVQEQTGIPYALLDGRLSATPKAYRDLGRLIGRPEDGERMARASEAILTRVAERIARVPQGKRPRVYVARGPRGLETGRGTSINVESLALIGAVNVAGEEGGGLATVSIEQVLAWDPDVIVTIDRSFAASVRDDPAWAPVRAVREGRVHLSPRLPFGWIDFPPSVNRLIGLLWLGKILHPELFPEDMLATARGFYQTFYHVAPSDDALARVLAGRE
ncbi:iron ABC transporter substrate-binding protein [Enterovirga rhinocerotis]|uniref:Iron complex transport system substrate-binding protein n=1 Tax=Enterovirga rhinocerotis TaxID=1339210 RepID=A0A4R7C491_9HYPH|nr:iron ABC transporter substrate-binding protein [Enterovirga rhinocerotis]TDR93208.1 iron complex transport system substrate-binding protein [Enterovirga rhinocerotis]